MKRKIYNFQDLVVWQLASEFSKEIAHLVKRFPKSEQYALSDDLLRAARSIPSNIAEGWGRIFPKEKISFYNISKGSGEECINHLIEAFNNGYIDAETRDKMIRTSDVIKIKLTNLIISTRKYIKIPLQRKSR